MTHAMYSRLSNNYTRTMYAVKPDTVMWVARSSLSLCLHKYVTKTQLLCPTMHSLSNTCPHTPCSLQRSSINLHTTVPNVIIVAKITNYFRKTVITTVITADTQCEYVVTNRNYDGDDITFATIITFGTFYKQGQRFKDKA